MAALHISLAAEPIFHLGNLSISNSIFTAWLISLGLIGVGFLASRKFRRIPGNIQSVLELLSDGLLDTMEKVIGRRDVARDLFPYIITVFLFIVTSNWSGLLPGVGSFGLHEVIEGEKILNPIFRAPTADLNMVVALAIFSVVYVQYLGLKYLKPKAYFSKFFNFSSPIYFFVGLIELVSEFTRIISFSFRLFGNVFAGEVLISVIFYLTYTLAPALFIIPLPFFLLELFVGLIQAFVFCFLTIVFAGIAVAGHGDHEHVAHPTKIVVSKQV